MPLKKIEHYLVLTNDIDATRDFYCQPLGMTNGFRPELGFPGYWCYLGDTPCIHIADYAAYQAHSDRLGLPVSQPAPGTGPVDHIAFVATDYDAFVANLERHGVKAERLATSGGQLRQLFVCDPNGVKIELNFWQDAA
jgi:catechol 2,3-dioxygenase-like lactoylglutathione lyase family enzyme